MDVQRTRPRANKVIVICDEMYKRKADGRLDGVGWETMIIQGDIANRRPTVESIRSSSAPRTSV